MYIDLQEAINRILELHQLMEKCMHSNKEDQAMHYFKELSTEFEELRKYFGIPICGSSSQNSQSKTLKDVTREMYDKLSKLKAAVRMGREDIAERYIEELTETVTIYLDKASNKKESLREKNIDDSSGFIN
jgi:hypothetical protein